MSTPPLSGSALPRLLSGARGRGDWLDLAAHQRAYGTLPSVDADWLIDEVRSSGLRGRGGASFPAARKLAAVRHQRRVGAVVVNGSETEPASRKDELLLSTRPHLVLDGALLAARATGAGEIIVKLSEGASATERLIDQAVAERREPITIWSATGPSRYVAGEERAVIQFLNGGPAVPTASPPRPFQKGYDRRPTLVQNPETLANLALIGRYGAAWFRGLGTDEDPGTMLITLSGAVAGPGVYEVACGTPLTDLLAAAGGSTEPLQAVLVGGYFGSWLPWETADRLRLSREHAQSVGCSLGSGVLIALGQSACGLHESARLLAYLAGESAGQCGPCVYGLASIAHSFLALVEGTADLHERDRVQRWAQEIRGRGACHHPDGAARLLLSSLDAFGGQLANHARARCRARPVGLPLGRIATRGRR